MTNLRLCALHVKGRCNMQTQPVQAKPEYDTEMMTSITPEIDKAIGEAITEVLDDWGTSYNCEPITDLTFERNEYEERSGFIPFQNGGYNTLVIWPFSIDSSHRPAVFDDYMNKIDAACNEDFKKEYPDIAEDSNEYAEYEQEYTGDACPAVQIEIMYYGLLNRHNPSQEHDTVLVQVCTNTDAPYYRPNKANIVGTPLYLDARTPELATIIAGKLKEMLEALK